MSIISNIGNVVKMGAKVGKAMVRNVTVDPFTAQVQAESRRRKMLENAAKKTFTNYK